jgi:hypothetical protein
VNKSAGVAADDAVAPLTVRDRRIAEWAIDGGRFWSMLSGSFRWRIQNSPASASGEGLIPSPRNGLHRCGTILFHADNSRSEDDIRRARAV